MELPYPLKPQLRDRGQGRRFVAGRDFHHDQATFIRSDILGKGIID
ncbi:hypothetical protein ABT025_18990 [Streptomyces sp. NPDC002809]